MWNGISVPSGKKRLETLSSTYYSFITKKAGSVMLPIIPERTVSPPASFDEIDDEEEAPFEVPIPTAIPVPVPAELFVRQNRHMRTRPLRVVHPGTRINSSPSTSTNVNTDVIDEASVLRNSSPAAQRPSGIPRFQIRRRILTSSEDLPQEAEVSNGIQLTHTFPRRQLPYSPPSVANIIVDEPTISVVDRVQSQTQSSATWRTFADIPKPPTSSDYQDLTITRRPLETPIKKLEPAFREPHLIPSDEDESCSSGSRSVFDVEEDSKFEFYVEDQQSGEAVNLELKPALPNATEAPQTRIQKEIEILTTPVQQEEVTCSPTVETKDSAPALVSPQSSLIVYSNPRFGNRYACKDDEAITSVPERACLPPETSRNIVNSTEIPVYRLPVRAFSTSEKLKRDIIDKRHALKPVRRCHSEYTPEDGDVFEEPAVSVNHCQQIQPSDQEYRDSTLFIFPPVLSESCLSVCSKRKSCSSNELDDDLPNPDLHAIRKYNVECALADANLSIPPSDESRRRREGSSTYTFSGNSSSRIGSRFKVSSHSSSSIVTNIPCNAWMMFPIRVLPGEMVPWGLLIYVPIIFMMILLIGYCLVVWMPFTI